MSRAWPRGAGGSTRETELTFSTLRALCAGHGAMARATFATGKSPVDVPSAEPSGAEICLARPSQKRPSGRKIHNFSLIYKVPHRGVGCFLQGDASWHATCGKYQSISSGSRSMKVIPNERNIQR